MKALGTQLLGRQDLSRTNIMHQSEVLLQGQRPIQGSYPRISRQEHLHTRVLTYFKWVFPRHFFEYKRSDSPPLIMHFEDSISPFNLSQPDTKKGHWHAPHPSEVNC